MQLLNALNWRYAVREFSNADVPETLINTLLEATRLSPSSYGLQPYKLIVVRSRAVRARLLKHSYGQEKVLKSSHFVVFAAETKIGDDTVDRYAKMLSTQRTTLSPDTLGYIAHIKAALSSMTEDQQQQWAREQAYIALGNFLTSAAILGIDSCPMTGFDGLGYDLELGLAQKGLAAVAVAALGQRSPSDQTSSLKKIRRTRDDFVLEIE